MTRYLVNVATTKHYQRGQARLLEHFVKHAPGVAGQCYLKEPPGCPLHSQVPYAFKAYAMQEASKRGDILLWCDACILPIRSLDPLWERIESDGYWFGEAGWSNYEWTAESVYPDLFPGIAIEEARTLNRSILHVVATAFGIDMRSDIGAAFLREYFRLASETKAFCGPWINANAAGAPKANGVRCAPCGPPDVRGHRHDQSAGSVIAWRLGMKLTQSPNMFSYKGGETEQTILVADGSYQ